MAIEETTAPTGSSAARLLPLLFLLFVGSGCAALIYEIVWFQLLQFVVGSTAVSLGVLLATFMGGMCLGSLLLPRLISTSRHPIMVYGILELGVGVFGLLELLIVPLAGSVYTAIPGHGFFGLAMRAALAALCLLPPTILMGATLPALSRWIETTREGVSWMGFFYGGNIAGAVIGCAFAGFFLLRVSNMVTATVVAALINAAIGFAATRLAAKAPHKLNQKRRDDGSAVDNVKLEMTSKTPVFLCTALSGFGALGAEVVWTRLLSLELGPSVYAFSIILAVFLIGLGFGSGAGSFVARKSTRPGLALGVCQILLTLAIVWTGWTIVYSVPYWAGDPATIVDTWKAFEVDLMRCLWAVFPAAFLWGASFPLALAAGAEKREDPGKLVGEMYAANTIGAILGSLIFSTVVVPRIGSQQAERCLVAVAALSGLVMLTAYTFRRGAPARLRPLSLIGILAMAAIGTIAGWSMPAIPGLLLAYGRDYTIWAKSPPSVRYTGEGLNSSIAVTEWPSGTRNFHVAGKIEASSANRDMRLERMLGHISALMHPHPKSVLIVGFGAGVTAGTFVLHPDIQRIVICEIEPLIPAVVSKYFAKENYDVLHDPRVEVVYDDARHYILTTKEKFDIITSDPIHPWVKGAATLYTTEYFETAKKHLNPGGVITQWVPLYDSSEDVVQSEFATFFKSFPYGTVWSSDIRGRGYDVVLLGQDGPPPKINLDEFAARLNRPDHQKVVESLEQVGFKPALSLLTTYAGYGPELRGWLDDAEINTDMNLRLQYLAGLDVHFTEEEKIFHDLLLYRKLPPDIFTGSPEMQAGFLQALTQ